MIPKRFAYQTINLTVEQKRSITKKNIKGKLLKIMKKHIGREKRVARSTLFKKLLGVEYNESDMKHYFFWGMIRQVLMQLRQHSLCFIVAERNAYEPEFYVLKTDGEASDYVEKQNKAIKAVGERWHAREWTQIEYKKKHS